MRTEGLASVSADSDIGRGNEISTFAQNVSALLDRVEYRRCDKGEDLEDIYRLRYKSYRMVDMVSDIPDQIIHDALDETPNCLQVRNLHRRRTRQHFAHPSCSLVGPVSPSTMVYGDILKPMMAEGISFIDCSRFAVDPQWSRIHPQIPYLTIRLAGIACGHFNAPQGLLTIREEHAGFTGASSRPTRSARTRSYPGLNYPVVLYRTTVQSIRERGAHSFPFFKWTPMEERMLFAPPGAGELAPLTILPTAKYMRDAA